jgi:hypothetical protein
MSELSNYVIQHTEPNACRCGKCIDSRENRILEGHTVNMYYFDVSLKGEPKAEDLVKLTNSHRGAFHDANPLDAGEHSYRELGGWLGDQGLAIQYMALGKMLRLWDIMHPGMILNLQNPEEKQIADQMAGAGMISAIVKKS